MARSMRNTDVQNGISSSYYEIFEKAREKTGNLVGMKGNGADFLLREGEKGLLPK